MLHSFVSLAHKFRIMFLLVLVFEGKKTKQNLCLSKKDKNFWKSHFQMLSCSLIIIIVFSKSISFWEKKCVLICLIWQYSRKYYQRGNTVKSREHWTHKSFSEPLTSLLLNTVLSVTTQGWTPLTSLL